MTVGQTPPGWYDDGRGQLRYYDGSAWTEHVQPLPQAAPPPPPPPPAPAAPPAAPVAPAAPAAPSAPVAAPAAAAGAGAAVGAASTAPATQTVAPTAAAAPATPIYKKPWFIIAVVVALLALAGAAFALSGSGDDDTATPSTGGTPAPTGSVAGGTSFVGQDASAVATKAACAPVTVIPASTTPPVQGAAPQSLVSCTLTGTTYTIATWASAADQANTASLANAFTAPVEAGTKYYATGDGWTAFDPTYTQASAQAFATAAGGTVKSVVVVTATGAPTP